MSTTRRELMGVLAASGAMLVTPQSGEANPTSLDFDSLKKDTDLACLYHCDFGDPKRFSQMMQNMMNHYAAYDYDSMKLKLVVVALGPSVKFFLEDLSGTPWEKETLDPDLYKRFAGLAKYGTEGYLCRTTYKNLNIDPAKTRKDSFLKFVPSGVATAAELQAKGFSYLKVG